MLLLFLAVPAAAQYQDVNCWFWDPSPGGGGYAAPCTELVQPFDQMPIVQLEEPGIPREDVRELVEAYKVVIENLEASIKASAVVIKAKDTQIAALVEHQKALENHNQVLRGLAGSGKSKWQWLWWGGKTAATTYTVCELVGVC